MEIGVTSFADLTDDAPDAARRLRELVEEIELADAVGLDVFGVGGARIAINSHAHVAENAQQAADEMFPSYATMMNRVGREVLRAIELLGTEVAPRVREQVARRETLAGAVKTAGP